MVFGLPTDLSRGDTQVSRVSGKPHCSRAGRCDSGGSAAAGDRDRRYAFRSKDSVGSSSLSFGAEPARPTSLAVYASQRGSLHDHARLAYERVPLARRGFTRWASSGLHIKSSLDASFLRRLSPCATSAMLRTRFSTSPNNSALSCAGFREACADSESSKHESTPSKRASTQSRPNDRTTDRLAEEPIGSTLRTRKGVADQLARQHLPMQPAVVVVAGVIEMRAIDVEPAVC